MDTYRTFLAIIISFVILLGYQYLFVGFEEPAVVGEDGQQIISADGNTQQPAASVSAPQVAQPPQMPASAVTAPMVAYDREPRDIVIDTELYTATVSEDGGTVTSFVLKKQTETNAEDSPGMQLVKTDTAQGYPFQFSWGSVLPGRILFESDKQSIVLDSNNGRGELKLTANVGNGLVVERMYSFSNESYLLDVVVKVYNNSEAILQGAPQLALVNTSFEGVVSPASRFLFSGPAMVMNGELSEISPDDYETAPLTVHGAIEWAGFEGNYFLCAMVPKDGTAQTFTMEGNTELTRSRLTGALDTLQPGETKVYDYHVFLGPKKLKMLKAIGYNLDKSVNFGWFDVIAKPALWLLNMFYSIFHNYGIAIILVTILFKGLFWPISQKGMKSMKNMQKLQPKMVKIKEKYKDDPTRMNQEVMNLYKTYKVNPLGGCLPMLLQIPVFFALYKVLLQSIELRHAPFMMWITDLSAPDRLWIGFDIPYLGGLPVLTLMMGASMFFQQKLTPSTADPTQAKIMMFLPLIFTFMFLNFASGLVLYWLVNNLLSILQQVLINRERKTSAA